MTVTPPIHSYSDFLNSTFLSDFYAQSQEKIQLSKLQRLTGLRLNTIEEQLFWLLQMHQLAFESECHHNYSNADFFFKKTYRTFKKIIKNEKNKQALASLFNLSRDKVSTDLNQKIFIASHWAFYQNFVTKEDAEFKERSAAHLVYLKELSQLLPPSVAQEMTTEIDQMLLSKYLATKNFKQAINICEQHLNNDDANEIYFWQQRNLMWYEQAFDKIEGESNYRKINLLKQALKKLENARRDIADDYKIYDYISVLKYHLSIAQAHEKKLADALLSIEEAIHYNPAYFDFYNFRQQLTQAMENLQKDIRSLLARMGYNQRLTAEGEAMKKEANVGFSRMNVFKNSEKATLIKEERELAYLFNVWTRISDEAAEKPENWRTIAKYTDQVAAHIFKAQNKNEAYITQVWQNQQEVTPELKEVSLAQFIDYVNYYFDPKQKEKEEVVNAVSALTHIQLELITAANDTTKKAIPFDFWLASTRAWGVKLMAVAAILLVFVTGMITLSETWKTQQRENAYQQILSATTTEEDFLTLSEHVEQFLSNRSNFKKDVRESYVTSVYEKSFTDWFLASEQVEDAIVQREFELFKSLTER